MLAGWLFIWWRFLRLALHRGQVELAVLGRLALFSPTCPAAKLAALIGPAYWLGPVDLIPNSLPYIGYLDQTGFLLGGLVLARNLVPDDRVRAIRDRLPPPVLGAPITLVFCHCPKTAGTSLFRALSHRLGYRTSYLMRRRRPNLARLQRRGFAFVAGHAPYGHYRDAGPLDSRTCFVTFYRDPRAVLLSRFAHMLRHWNDHAATRHFFGTELPARGLARTAPEALQLFLARYGEFDASEADNPQTRFAANHFFGPLDSGHLERAKETFAAMELVGCTERFEESLRLLAYRLGWTRLTYHRLNVSGSGERIPMTPALAAELDQHLALDHQLVAWAAARFDRDYAAMVADCAAQGRPLPEIELLDAEPPFRRPRNRLAAATTLLPDDWRWWLGTRWETRRRAATASVSRRRGAGDRDRS
jgi:hypothetical protein